MAKSKRTTTRKTKTTKKTARKAATPAKPPTPRTITPYLAVGDAASEIEWIKKVFGAKETARQMAGPMIMHAALRIGDSDVYLADIFPGSDIRDPSRVGASVTVNVYHKDIKKFWDRAMANGAKVIMPLDKQFWGDWYGQFRDPAGHAWALNFPAKMTQAEKDRKRAESMAQMGAPPA
jgi:uncharacterized glyoxalase superfamily protein PhnB